MKKRKIILGAAMALATASVGGVTAQAMTISEIAQSAVPVANEYGLYPSVMIAQALIESGAGESTLATQYNNYFGVKWTSGEGVDLPTTEFIDGQMESVTQKFQVYGSVAESFDAQAQLLRSSLYSGTWRENTSSYMDATAALQGTYATAPDYASILNNTIAQYNLTAYDGGNYTQPAVASSGGETYTVQQGDSFWGIAEANGTTVDALAAANGLDTSSVIQVGQILQLPGASSQSTSSVQASAQSTGTYTVQEGDSFWSIALANGMTAENLAALNGMDLNSVLQPGMTLSLTGGSSSTGSGTASGGAYTVQAGDTLWSIAQTLGTTVDQLQQANGINNAGSLQIGEVLNY